MKCFITKTGETAYVPSELEKAIYQIGLRQFANVLPSIVLEGASDD